MMLKFYTTLNRARIEEIEKPEPGCWISAVAPTPEEVAFLKNEIGVLPEFIKASLDEEETAHIDKDDDQTLIVIDYPSQEESVTDEEETLVYMTLPLGVVFIKDYIVTISLYDNMTNEEIRNGRIRGLQTNLRTRFLLLTLLRVSQRYLIYLKQIDRISTRTENKLHQSMRNKEIFQLLGLEKSLVYFSTSLKSDESVVNKIMRGNVITIFEEDSDLLEDVLIELNQAKEMCNIYSDILSKKMDAFSSVISNNLNNVMKILASLTIIMEIPNIIFAYYGMNVTGLPFPMWWPPIIIAGLICSIAAYVLLKKDLIK